MEQSPILLLIVLTLRLKHQGFTIVELLIVIVVLAVLASISFVAYQGIQTRAHNSALQNDLTQFARKIQLIAADTGTIPAGGMIKQTASAPSTGSVIQSPGGVTMKVTQSSYFYTEATSGGMANFIYCSGPSLVSGQTVFSIVATSRSGVMHRYNSSSGATTIIATNASTPGVVQACNGIDYPQSFSYGFFVNSGGWQSWMSNS